MPISCSAQVRRHVLSVEGDTLTTWTLGVTIGESNGDGMIEIHIRSNTGLL